MKQNLNPTNGIQQIIGNWLRFGVLTACAIACVGGLAYLWQHGGEPVKDYSQFSYDHLPAGYESYTTLGGIIGGVCHFMPTGWIQLGVIVLFLTPIVRVVLSLSDFLRQRDWLYAAITAFVLGVIVLNSLS